MFLSVAVGTLEFELGVPFYDRAEINQAREDSYKATERDADWIAAGASGASSGDCVHEYPTVLTRNGTLVKGPMPSKNCQRSGSHTLNVLYISKDRTSNILTSENLRKIKEIEDHILDTQDLSKYCQLVDSNYTVWPTRDVEDWREIISDSIGATEFNHAACRRFSSALNFMDPLYFDYANDSGLGYHLIRSDVISPEYNFDQTYVDSVVDYWADYPDLRTYDLSNNRIALEQNGGAESLVVPNLFHKVVSSEFTSGSTGAVGLISSYPLGLPIHGYGSASESRTEQFEESGQWLWDELDAYLKEASFGDVEVYFADSQGGMSMAEGGYLAMVSFSFFPASIGFVLLYLTYMQDSFFIGLVGIMQILLSFLPGVILYRYMFQQTYLGILNLIAVYIILGIGVANIFVFCDQFNHNLNEKRFDQRLQKTFNTAARAMFNTTATTFVSFMSNAVSVFPAVSAFGLFAALLVFVNYCAVVLFFPTAYAMYFRYIKHKWWDHPSRVFRCNTAPWTEDVFDATPTHQRRKDVFEQQESSGLSGVETTATQPDASDRNNEVGTSGDDHRRLVTFFRDRWGPMVVKFRIPIVVFFLAVFGCALYLMGQLEPEEDFPQILPESNNYVQYADVLLEHYARAGNPTAIKVYWVSGVDPDDPIDRSGTTDTNTSDYGESNYVGCRAYDPTTAQAQVWALQTCHDLFFGNVTAYHDDEGDYGPRDRRIVSDRIEPNEFNYYGMVSCPAQGLRDWLLTESGCRALANRSLPCYEETRQREGCTAWDTAAQGNNSCEPYPVPPEHYTTLLQEFLFDPTPDPTTRLTNYDKFFDQVFVAHSDDLSDDLRETVATDDFSCRRASSDSDLTLLAMSTVAVLEQDFGLSYEDGIDLYQLWNGWSAQMRRAGPSEMKATMQTSNGAWGFYYLSETLIDETYSSIYLALGLGFVILAVVGGNPIMAFFSVFTICLIVVNVFAYTVLMGWSLGILEAVNYVVVIGLSIDYCVHMSQAYTLSHSTQRIPRVIQTFEEMGVSVLSSSLSTLGASFFMFFAPVVFFVKFAAFIFVTISLSTLYSLTFFPALLAIVGPTGDFGNWHFWLAKKLRNSKAAAKEDGDYKLGGKHFDVDVNEGLATTPSPTRHEFDLFSEIGDEISV